MITRTKLAPRIDRRRYTHSYVIEAVPSYAPYAQVSNGVTTVMLGRIEWNAVDREAGRNNATRSVAYLHQTHGVLRIDVVGPLSVRDHTQQRLSKARAWDQEWRVIWSGAIADGVTLGDALVRFRALRTAMQEDADAYRSGQ